MSPSTTIPSPDSTMKKHGLKWAFFGDIPLKKDNNAVLGSRCVVECYNDFRYCSFNGKEKDYESGFHYYGARYYWSELLTGWLSVDPMMDKYPGISPYAYCAWNPVRLVDPDGRKWMNSKDLSMAMDKLDNVQNVMKNLKKCNEKYYGKMENLRSNMGKSSVGDFFRMKKLSKLNNEIIDNNQRIEKLNAFTEGLSLLSNDENTYYTFHADNANLVHPKYDSENSIFTINYCSEENKIHETTHAIQFCKGALGFKSVANEVDAYSTQYSYNPSSVRSIDAGIMGVSNMSSITPQWVQSIQVYEYGADGSKTIKHPYADFK